MRLSPCAAWLGLWVGMTAFAGAGTALAQEPLTGSVEGVLRARGSGVPVAGAMVRIDLRSARATSDSAGVFRMTELAAGQVRLQVLATGYVPYGLTIRVPRGGVLRLDVELVPRVQQLPPENVRAPVADSSGEALARAAFERHVVPGATTLSRHEMQRLPALAESDVLRSLQMLPGMIAVNDLDAQLYVRGGGADQNLFLLDGAPVYGAYHAFGMSGAFNSDAIEGVEFFRGTRPARYGGALSSVVAIEQQVGQDATEGGLSLLGARLAHQGTLGSSDIRYMVAARRSLTDLVAAEHLPFGFHDAQMRLELPAWRGHQVGASAFASGDRFQMFIGDGGEELRSTWGNAVGVVRWRSPAFKGIDASSSAWVSRYEGTLRVGIGGAAPRTTDGLTASGMRLDLAREFSRTSVRAGVELDHLDVALAGDSVAGSFFAGTARRTIVRPAGHVEVEHRAGPLRIVPGVRAVGGPMSLLEPRIGIRAQRGNTALTVGASRDHQGLSMLRDERTVLPGAPMWFLHPAGHPVSRADAISAELTSWIGKSWSATVGGYERWFRDTPHWRPEGRRDLSTLSYDAGRAFGVEVGARRFGSRLAGWIGYGFNQTTFVEPRAGETYASIADRTHAVNAVIVARPGGRTTVSAQAAIGTGLPFWPMVGDVLAPQVEPFDAFHKGFTLYRLAEAWSAKQVRMPTYARIDVSIRHPFRVGRTSLEPFLSVMNVGARPNVVYYTAEGERPTEVPMLRPVTWPWTILPTFGIDVRF